MRPDWDKLVSQGRAKAIGVPWSEAEAEAIFQRKIPSEYVRNGCLTKEAYEAAQSGHAKEGKPRAYRTKADLITEAKEKGLQFDETEISRSDLLDLLGVT